MLKSLRIVQVTRFALCCKCDKVQGKFDAWTSWEPHRWNAQVVEAHPALEALELKTSMSSSRAEHDSLLKLRKNSVAAAKTVNPLPQRLVLFGSGCGQKCVGVACLADPLALPKPMRMDM